MMEEKYDRPALLEIVEKFTMSKTGRQEDNEDLLYIDDKFVAVIDGATGKSGARFGQKTAGQLSAQLAAQVLKSLGGQESAREAVGLIQEEMRRFSLAHELDNQKIYLCASAVIYSRYRQQIWAVGDCQYSIDGTVQDNRKRVDEILGEARALAICSLLEEGMTERQLLAEDLGRQMILPFLKKQRFLENARGPYGFPVLNGDGHKVRPQVVSVPSGAEVVLASDGYPFLKGSLSESEDALEELLRKDPLCYKSYRSTKGRKEGNISFDDRTYVKMKRMNKPQVSSYALPCSK